MAAIISLKLDRRSKMVKKDGTCPICLSLRWAGAKSYISLGRSVDPDHWSAEFGRLTKAAKVKPNPGKWNEWLTTKLDEAEAVIEYLRDNGDLAHLTHNELKHYIIHGRYQPRSFTEYLDDLVGQFRAAGKDGQVRIYSSVKRFLVNYGDKPSGRYEFKEINYRLLRMMEEKFQPRKTGNFNGLAVYMRTIRAIWNRAIKEGVVDAALYPFNKYSIRKTRTHKSAIRTEDLLRINLLDLPVGTKAWHGRNLFFFSFYANGMNFADLAVLRWSDIRNGRICYVRKKTHKPLSIMIVPEIQAILDLYRTRMDGTNGYIFPVVESQQEGESVQATRYLYGVNHALKRWARQLGIDASLSFNTARHTWATQARNLHLPIAVISQSLGHADIETTQIYLDEFDTSALDQATLLVSSRNSQKPSDPDTRVIL